MPLDISDCHSKVVSLLVAERERAGLKQYQLADLLKLEQSLLSRLESGQRKITVCEFFIFAKVLSFDPYAALHRIMGDADSPKPRGGRRRR
jgi:transcriptional regulator with XRE-family HTH domain